MTSDEFSPSPMHHVTAETSSDGRETLVFVRVLDHPVEAVWAALVEPAQLNQWAPFVSDRPLDSTGPATLSHIDRDIVEDAPAPVLRAEPMSVLEYLWDRDLIRWELEPSGAGTALTLRHTVAEPDVIADVAGGWHLCLDVVDRLLAGRPVGAIRGQDAMQHGWRDLRDAYARRLGVTADSPAEHPG